MFFFWDEKRLIFLFLFCLRRFVFSDLLGGILACEEDLGRRRARLFFLTFLFSPH